MKEAVVRLWRFCRTPEGLKVVRYTMVSVISALTSLVILTIVYGVLRLWGEVFSTLFANVLAGIPSYILNRRWVWGKSGRSHIWREIIPFWVMSISGIGFALYTASLAHNFADAHHLHHLARTVLVVGANLAAFGILWILKFLILNRLFAEMDPVPINAPIDKGDLDVAMATSRPLRLRDLDAAIATCRPLRLTDIDRMLEESARIEHAGSAAPIRTWRDELTVALECLAYAGAVLAGDVGILCHSLARRASAMQNLVEDLPRAMAPRAWGDGWSTPSPTDDTSPVEELWENRDDDWDVFTRSDLLMSSHQQMAYTDLRSRIDVTRVLRSILEQLANLAQRRDGVEARLRQIRAVELTRSRGHLILGKTPEEGARSGSSVDLSRGVPA